MPELLQEIRDSLISGLAAARMPERIGGFLYLRSPDDTLKWMNQSIPVDQCSTADARRLLDRYRQTDREPFLELFPALCPDGVAALEEVGLVNVHESPIMAMHRDEWTRTEYADRARAGRDIGDIRAGSFAAMRAFGGTEPGDAEKTWKSVREGRLLYAVGFSPSGIVASGQAVGTREIREVAGIGTLPEFQRQGFAAAVIECLLDQHFGEGGTLAWLTPGDAGAESLYRKLGFKTIGVQAAYGLPES